MRQIDRETDSEILERNWISSIAFYDGSVSSLSLSAGFPSRSLARWTICLFVVKKEIYRSKESRSKQGSKAAAGTEKGKKMAAMVVSSASSLCYAMIYLLYRSLVGGVLGWFCLLLGYLTD